MARRHPCDVCGHPRLRWQRLCGVCWQQLPAEIRSGLTGAWRRHAKPEWRRWKAAAIDHLAARVSRHMARISGERAFQITAIQMGESDR